MTVVHKDALHDDYDELRAKQERLQRMDEVVSRIDCDWGDATVERMNPGSYKLDLSYQIIDHEEVFPKFEGLLEWEETNFNNKVIDHKYISYTLWIDLEL